MNDGRDSLELGYLLVHGRHSLERMDAVSVRNADEDVETVDLTSKAFRSRSVVLYRPIYIQISQRQPFCIPLCHPRQQRNTET